MILPHRGGIRDRHTCCPPTVKRIRSVGVRQLSLQISYPSPSTVVPPLTTVPSTWLISSTVYLSLLLLIGRGDVGPPLLGFSSSHLEWRSWSSRSEGYVGSERDVLVGWPCIRHVPLETGFDRAKGKGPVVPGQGKLMGAKAPKVLNRFDPSRCRVE